MLRKIEKPFRFFFYSTLFVFSKQLQASSCPLHPLLFVHMNIVKPTACHAEIRFQTLRFFLYLFIYIWRYAVLLKLIFRVQGSHWQMTFCLSISNETFFFSFYKYKTINPLIIWKFIDILKLY